MKVKRTPDTHKQPAAPATDEGRLNAVAVVGMENFNRSVWTQVKSDLAPDIHLQQWTDLDLDRKPPELAQAIQEADCLFLTMINFREQADWLREQVARSRAQTIFAYESMPEIMALNKVGDYAVSGKGGMPEPIKRVARLLVKGREEDTLYGYTKLMKLMQTMMRFMPDKARDFKNWMTVNIYWNQPLPRNIVNMFRLIAREYFGRPLPVEPVVEVPMMGLYHPDAPGFFKDMKSFREWERRRKPEVRSQNTEVRSQTAEDAPPNTQHATRNTQHAIRTTRHATRKSTVGLLFFRKHLVQERGYIDDVIRAFENAGLSVLPMFVAGIEGHVAVRDWLAKEKIDLLVSTIGFALVGGPAGSTAPGLSVKIANDILGGMNVPYIVAQPLYVQDFDAWQRVGVGPMQSTVLYALPEMDGAIDPVVIGALHNGGFRTAPDRLERLTTLARNWIALRHTPNKDKRLAIVAYDYPPGLGRKATAALLDVPRSLLNLLRRLQAEGYHTGPLPETPERLFEMLDAATGANADGVCVTADQYRAWVSPDERERIEARWGAFPGEIAPQGRDRVFIGGLQLGNIYIGVQPRFGVQGDPMRLLFDKANTPHHQYISFYRWIARGFGAHALIHVGMHGSAEWMPGLQLGLTRQCWSDALLGELPHLYLYPVNNPSEANIAKRRGYAVMISHATPPMTRAGLYKELAALREMLDDYRQRAADLRQAGQTADATFEEAVLRKVALVNLDNDCPRHADEPFDDYASRLYAYLRELEDRLITGALHVLGEASPIDTQAVVITELLKARGNGHSLAALTMRALDGGSAPSGYADLAARARQGDPAALQRREQVDRACREFVECSILGAEQPGPAFSRATGAQQVDSETAQALDAMTRAGRELARALSDHRAEVDAVVRALAGGFIPSGPGGDLIRDGINVLPTGRNIHAIDPWRIPSELAFARGAQIADAILARHLEENNGAYPETIAQVLWGLDTIKTKGEAIGTVLRLIGARPAYDGQGKISHYELIPLSELDRPRIDVLMNLSPVFRDTFGIVMDHLDRLVRAAAQADEPPELNFIRKHVQEQMAAGADFDCATARLFTQSPGNYGTYVDDMIEDSAWQTEDDLDALFIRRNAYAYGGKRHGEHAPEIFQRLLGTVGRVVQEIDSVEFGVADIDHYFASSGALHLAARRRHHNGVPVKLNYIESFTAETRVDDVDKVLRMEYRSRLLNPRWYEGMLQHGHSGAAEISNRFTYMLGWDAVSNSVDDWVYTQAAQTYALDPAMRERLAKANPQAMRNIVGRLLEANGRGLWQADDAIIEQLREMYADLEDRLEGVPA